MYNENKTAAEKLNEVTIPSHHIMDQLVKEATNKTSLK
jgi:hypothetical protein